MGMINMAMTICQIPREEVSPAAWQNTMGVRGKYPRQTVTKYVPTDRAQKLWPTVKVTHYIADALLLAEYARKRFQMEMEKPW